MIIIGLSGKKRVGKNSTYYLLKLLLDEDDEGKVRKVAFADTLKHVAFLKGWNGKKDDKGRKLLQDLGMQMRARDKNYWVKAALLKIDAMRWMSKLQIIVITDVRFLNEVEAIKRLNGEVWRICRPSIEAQATDTHPSEVELDNYTDFDATLTANDMTGLLKCVEAEVLRLKQEKKIW